MCVDSLVFVSVCFLFIFYTAYVVLLQHGGVDLMGLKPNP